MALLSSNSCMIEYHCKHCPYESRWEFALTNHMKRHHQEMALKIFNCAAQTEPYRCNVCNDETEFQLCLYQHRSSCHVNEAPPELELCKVEFIKQEPLDIKPEVIELDESENLCLHCGLITFSKLFLMNHMTRCEKLLQNQWFECPHCEYKTKMNSHLKKHQIARHTADIDIKWFGCLNCEYKSKERGNLKRHQISKHTAATDIQWLKCPNCEYKSKDRSSLKRHIMRRHVAAADIHWFECPDCEYKAKGKFQIKRHQIARHIVATDIKWFECPDCEYKAKGKSHLKRHQIGRHTAARDIKWFKCPDCKYKAKLKDNLHQHQIRKHSRRN